MTEPAAPDLGYERFDCTSGDPEVLDRAAEAARAAIERGECIVLPTDTVYGIGADAFSAEAVQRLLDAKIRGRDMPPPVLVSDIALLKALATEVPEAARTLVAWYWPGPLTIICKAQPSLMMDLGETAGTIALRVPAHDLAREILRRTGPMAVSSANISGMPAATTCDEAADQLADRVSVYVDGGPSATGGRALPSTIVDFTQVPSGAILRHGALTAQQIRDVLPDVLDLDDDDEPGAVGSASTDPMTTESADADEPVGAAPDDTEPDGTEPDGTEPAGTEPDGTGPTESRSEPSGAPASDESSSDDPDREIPDPGPAASGTTGPTEAAAPAAVGPDSPGEGQPPTTAGEGTATAGAENSGR